MKEKAEKVQALCRIIDAAFDGVTLGNGVGLQQAQGLDDYADAETLAAYRATDEKDDWRCIPATELNRCNSSLSFFDAEGMRFHLPAYLIADLRDEYHFGMDFCLTHSTEYSFSQFALLSEAQRSAVRAFLQYLTDDPEYDWEGGRPEIMRALAEYWIR